MVFYYIFYKCVFLDYVGEDHIEQMPQKSPESTNSGTNNQFVYLSLKAIVCYFIFKLKSPDLNHCIKSHLTYKSNHITYTFFKSIYRKAVETAANKSMYIYFFYGNFFLK